MIPRNLSRYTILISSLASAILIRTDALATHLILDVISNLEGVSPAFNFSGSLRKSPHSFRPYKPPSQI